MNKENQNNGEGTPKAFISYSWSNQPFALELAEALRADGVKIVIDKWDLRPGQDMYRFMERCVADPTISKVVLLSDRTYREKADDRRGGVGAETALISSEVYRNSDQTKFIPVALEWDEEMDEPVLPVYLKSKYAIRLLDKSTTGAGYRELVKAIYEEYDKPKTPLGKRPAWLDNPSRSQSFKQESRIKQESNSRLESLLPQEKFPPYAINILHDAGSPYLKRITIRVFCGAEQLIVGDVRRAIDISYAKQAIRFLCRYGFLAAEPVGDPYFQHFVLTAKGIEFCDELNKLPDLDQLLGKTF